MCEYQGPDEGGGTVLCREWRKARKEHSCGECGGKIAIGESHHFISGIWEGEFDFHRSCVVCRKLGEEFSKAHDGEGFYMGALDEALQECVAEETTIDEDDNEVLSESAQRWQKALDEMNARKAVANVSR